MNEEYQEFLARFQKRAAAHQAEFEKAVERTRKEVAKAEAQKKSCAMSTEGAQLKLTPRKLPHVRSGSGLGPVRSILRRG